MKMKFPNLEPAPNEKTAIKALNDRLLQKLETFFEKEYGLKPEIKASGSTERKTNLPKKFFGADLDVTVKADETLVSKIAYKSNLFEGCQLFSIDFFRKFSEYFENVYFAGHRLSGKIAEMPFDFSITDAQKDKWKWQMNKSKYYAFSAEGINEARKSKYFFKLFNVSGSDIYGVVGPAAELLIYHNKKLQNVIGKIKDFVQLNDDFSGYFNTTAFPNEFKELFGKSEDYIHKGLVDSFRYTCPNTYNRLIEICTFGGLNINKFIKRHNPAFNYIKELPSNNCRLLFYVLGSGLKGKKFFHMDILPVKDKQFLFAKTSKSEASLMNQLCQDIGSVISEGDLNYSKLPRYIQENIASRCADPARYIFFAGKPSLQIKKNAIYVPFDILIREDAEKLISIMESGQNESK